MSGTPQKDVILGVEALGFPWKTHDPFLFCVHHDDAYPAGNGHLGPAASLEGRDLGQDFEGKDGWRMYHGDEVPGFPGHPHRGFETVTVVRRGFVDHADSLGATARYGQGDAQWLTAGAGIVHAEMFPLVEEQKPNPLELFQIWLNLAKADKMAPPHFAMFWSEKIPTHEARDANGKLTSVRVVAGRVGDAVGLPPPPRSWAARPDSDVAIWTLALEPGARFTLPPGQAGSNRTIYFFRGGSLKVAGQAVPGRVSVRLQPDAAVALENGAEPAEILLLQGKPIGEPVVQYGPFVMTSRQEIEQTFAEYQRTRFGGWPWASDEPTHPAGAGRFAVHADGHKETAGQ
jgi:redox-sensitive bicupin YhaK (pirin superfamily)